MKAQLFENLKEMETLFEIKKVENAVYKIDSLTINLTIKLTQESKFIDNLVVFYCDVKKAALSKEIKLTGFRTDKIKWTVDFKASGTLQNLNNFLFELNCSDIKFSNN
ncbi:MAG: hypothetical protein M1412_01760 [Deltaproteobacteria bacterium]|nr:hypothetical protein [Deltaproteobacteria bacterium]MCL5891881.1 hypothetical protein [Deltaproteobacteria bacterium]